MKKLLWISLAVLLLTGGTVRAVAGISDSIMLVVPARFPVMQVAFDVAKRYPTFLLSYQGSPTDPVLHIWDGRDWRPLSPTAYQSGAFLSEHPRRVFFLGDDSLLPPSLRATEAWCTQTLQIPELERTALINALGKAIPFTPADWRWFAGRYNLTLTNLKAEEAEAARRRSWYDEKAPVKDPAPSWFKYFTRSRRGAKPAPIAPAPAEETMDLPAP